jgi:hypothetical protein
MGGFRFIGYAIIRHLGGASGIGSIFMGWLQSCEIHLAIQANTATKHAAPAAESLQHRLLPVHRASPGCSCRVTFLIFRQPAGKACWIRLCIWDRFGAIEALLGSQLACLRCGGLVQYVANEPDRGCWL